MIAELDQARKECEEQSQPAWVESLRLTLMSDIAKKIDELEEQRNKLKTTEAYFRITTWLISFKDLKTKKDKERERQHAFLQEMEKERREIQDIKNSLQQVEDEIRQTQCHLLETKKYVTSTQGS